MLIPLWFTRANICCLAFYTDHLRSSNCRWIINLLASYFLFALLCFHFLNVLNVRFTGHVKPRMYLQQRMTTVHPVLLLCSFAFCVHYQKKKIPFFFFTFLPYYYNKEPSNAYHFTSRYATLKGYDIIPRRYWHLHGITWLLNGYYCEIIKISFEMSDRDRYGLWNLKLSKESIYSIL